jgi:dinuclear metal center YbgI/SA1388 family protein
MAKLKDIVKFLDKELNVKKFNSKDYCINGLQHKGSQDVQKIGFAVDSSLAAFELAKKAGCDLLITHHAAFGKDRKKYPEMRKLKKGWLKENRLSVYCAHAPLDAHNKYGNNAVMMQMLGIKSYKDFGEIDGIMWGKVGMLNSGKTVGDIARILNKRIPTKFKVLNYGNAKVKKIAAISGSGSDCYTEGMRKKVDLLIVGDIRYSHSVNIKDLKLNMISGGHYKTETLGVKALMPLLSKKFNVKTQFIASDTGF